MKNSFWVWVVLGFFAVSCGTPSGAEDTNGTGQDPAKQADLGTLLLDLEKRILDDPSNAELFAERAAVYADTDSLRNAINDMLRAIALDSTNVRYHLAVGQLYYSSLQVEKATDSYRTAARLDPNSLDAKINLAEIQLVLRNYQQSFDLVNEALRVDPHVAKGYYIKGWCYKELGDTVKSISSFQTAVEQDPSYYDAFMQLALLHTLKNDELALAYYNSALDIRPNSAEAWYDKGLYCQENGMDSIALVCYDKMKEVDPRNPLAWFNSGFVFLELQDDALAAKAQFARATELQPDYYQAWYNRGVAYEVLNELDSAKAAYKTALRITPTYDPAANGLSRLRDRGINVDG